MKKKSLWVFAALLLMLFLAVPAAAWKGRIAAVGDATGLIEDESDYLIHPSLIASGKGFNAYGHYRLTYDKATQWDYTASAPVLGLIFPFAASGYAWTHEAQLGAAFQLGAGRMGVFFDYTGVRGKYSGDEFYEDFVGPNYHGFDLENSLDNFAVRVLYGLPAGPVKLGGEIQIAYRREEKKTLIDGVDQNYLWAAEDEPAINLFPYMIPFKSSYWEAQGKISAGGSAGPVQYAATLRGSLPFASDNKYDRIQYAMEGNVKGFNIGGDVWVRVPLNDRMALPFLVSAGYKTLTRDGSYRTNWVTSHENVFTEFYLKVGGGIDLTPVKGTRIAAGGYYDYLQSKQKMSASDIGPSSYFIDEYTDMPNYSEHRLTLRVLAEQELCPMVTLRGGISGYYGFVKSDFLYFAYDDGGPFDPVNTPTSGSTFGVNAALGATVKLAPVALEPFVNAGYLKYKTSGDGMVGHLPVRAEFDKTNWLVGGGLSVKF